MDKPVELNFSGDEQSAFVTELNRCLKEASEYRRSIVGTRFESATRARLGYYHDCDGGGGETHGDKKNFKRTYINKLGTVMRNLSAWLKDIYMPAESFPYDISPTPKPDIPDDIKRPAIKEITRQILEIGLPPSAQLRKFIAQAKLVVENQIVREGEVKMRAMKRCIDDQLEHGNFRNAWMEFIDYLSYMPVSVLILSISPIEKIKWRNNELEIGHEPGPHIRCIAPDQCFWSPDYTDDPQNGSYFIHFETHCKSDLYEAREAPGFNTKVIDEILKSEVGDERWYQNYTEDVMDWKTDDRSYDSVENIVVAKAYKKMIGHRLKDMGAAGSEKLENNKVYEAEFWWMQDKLIYSGADLNKSNKRSVFFASMVRVPGQPIGQGPYDILIDLQRGINAHHKEYLHNQALSAGSIMLARAGSIIGGTPSKLRPYDILEYKSGFGDQRAPLDFFSIPNHGSIHLQGMEYYLRQMDEILGIPAFVTGGTPLGGVGRTIGTMSIATNQAMVIPKALVSDIDKRVIEPLIQMIYRRNLLCIDDPSIKFDASVRARGATELFNRSVNAMTALNDAQQTLNFAAQGAVSPELAQNVALDALHAKGINVSRERDRLIASQQFQNLQSLVQSPTQALGAALDGRSQPPVPVNLQIPGR